MKRLTSKVEINILHIYFVSAAGMVWFELRLALCEGGH